MIAYRYRAKLNLESLAESYGAQGSSKWAPQLTSEHNILCSKVIYDIGEMVLTNKCGAHLEFPLTAGSRSF